MLYYKMKNEYIPLNKFNEHLYAFCGGCHQFLHISQFAKNKTNPTGYHTECIECANKRAKEYYRRKCLATR